MEPQSRPLLQLAEACAVCIGQIGTVDFTQLIDQRIGSSSLSNVSNCPGPVQHADTVIHDLTDPEDRLELCCELIIDHLAPAFGFARSPHAQASAAFVIQELLKLLEFSTVLQDDDSKTSNTSERKRGKKAKRRTQQSGWHMHLQQRWELLPSNVVTMITPLLSSKYAIRMPTRITNSEKDAPSRILQM